MFGGNTATASAKERMDENEARSRAATLEQSAAKQRKVAEHAHAMRACAPKARAFVRVWAEMFCATVWQLVMFLEAMYTVAPAEASASAVG